MSQENVERLRPLYDAWRRGAYEEGLDVLDPQIEWRAAAKEATVSRRPRRPLV